MLKQSLRCFPVTHPAHISFLVMSFSVISMWLYPTFSYLCTQVQNKLMDIKKQTTDSILSINKLLQENIHRVREMGVIWNVSLSHVVSVLDRV